MLFRGLCLADRVVVSLAAASTLFSLAGCGSEDPIGVRPVSGLVTFKGEPLNDALVIFRPKTAGCRVASGRTRDDGSFTLITSGARRNGAIAGEYDVLISKVIEVYASGQPVDNSPQEYDPAAPPQERTRQKSLIPEKYNAPQSPLLSATVEKKNNSFIFDLAE